MGNIAKVEEKLPFNSNKKVEREIKRKRSLSEATVNNMLWDKMLQIKEDFWVQNERKVLEK